jgi:hypothetical protein
MGMAEVTVGGIATTTILADFMGDLLCITTIRSRS